MNEEHFEQRLDELSDMIARLTERVIALEEEKVGLKEFTDRITTIESDHEAITNNIENLKAKINEEQEEMEK